MAGRYGLTNRFCPSGLIVSVGCISTTAGILGVIIQPQTTDQTSYFLTRTLETTLTLISPSPTHGVVTSFHHLLVLVVPLQRGEQTERKRNTANSSYQVAEFHCDPLVLEHFGAWGSMGGNSCASYQKSHRTKWDDRTLQSLSTSGPNAFLFSSRSAMLESSLKSYLRCLKTTDVTSLPPSTLATSWY